MFAARLNIILLICLVIMIPISLMTGAVPLTFDQVVAGVIGRDFSVALILWDIRLPRTILALLIGGGLGLSGAVLQSMMRNPLADPSLFGAPQMAALGAVVVLSLGWANVYAPILPIVAILGTCISVGAVLMLAGSNGSVHTILLAGLAIGSLAGALTSLVLSLSPNAFAVTEIVFWLLGSFEDRSLTHVYLAAPFTIVGVLVLLSMGAGLKALTLGEDTAQTLGVHVAYLRWRGVIGVALCVGAGVAVAGAIGFIGLIIPHVVRALIGADPQKSLLPSMLMGAAVLLTADIGVRCIPAQAEIKIGVLTSLIGVPFFLFLVVRERLKHAF